MTLERQDGATTAPTQDEARPLANGGIRRSGRIAKEIPIILSGPDVSGRDFSEETKTLLLSRHGASILSRHKLVPEQEIFLRIIAGNRETEVRICGEIGERADGHIYGVAFLDSALDFWGMEFPAPEQPAKDLIQFLLQCTGCHQQVSVQMDATEVDVYAVNEGALRYCAKCATSTIWKISGEATELEMPASAIDVEPACVPTDETISFDPAYISIVDADLARPAMLGEPDAATEPPAAAAPAPPTAPVIMANRRCERRTKVRCNACIRVTCMKDEIVPCEDLSRGGFSFHSTRAYGEETILEVAVPYTADSAGSIFVKGQIANVFEIKPGKLWRYGVAYLRGPKT